MTRNRIIISAAILIIVVIATAVVILWADKNDFDVSNYVKYHYYMWKIRHTGSGGTQAFYYERLEEMSPHIIPLLIKTYENTDSDWRNRHGAALALIKADEVLAERLFINDLESDDEMILSGAIFHLYVANSVSSYDEVVSFANHNSDEVRNSIALYLGNFSEEKSIAILRRMRESDPSSKVRSSAGYSLQKLGLIPLGKD